MLSDSPQLVMLHFELESVNDRFFCSVKSRMWSSRVHSLCASSLACTDAAPDTVSTLLCCSYLLASRFGGSSPDLNSLSATSAAGKGNLKERRGPPGRYKKALQSESSKLAMTLCDHRAANFTSSLLKPEMRAGSMSHNGLIRPLT